MKNLTHDTYDKFICLENLHQETLTENLRDQLKKLKKEIFEDVKDIPLVDGFNIEILRWEKDHKIECLGHDSKETLFDEAEEEIKLFIKTVVHREPTKLPVAGIFPPSKIASQTSSKIYTKRDVHVQKTPSAFKRKMRETDDTQSLESKRERVDVSQLSEKMNSMDLATNNK